VLLGKAPELLFVDPSVQYRLWLYHYRAPKRRPGGFFIRPLASREDGAAQNRIYRACGMMTVDPDIVLANQRDSPISYFLAVDSDDGTILATITVIDHVAAFADAENGASFWCLAVNPKRRTAGVGKSLVRHAVEHLHAKGREYLDLSVLHDNRRAIRLYQSLGFQRIPVYVVKRRNRINKPLYSGGAQP
jgi:ribosomal protein S18 acetylase RimI-like enzyme